MKKKLLVMMLPLLSCVVCSCNGEKEIIDKEELTFSTENITNQENIKIVYCSPDPCCTPSKMYYIYANYGASEVTMRCDDAAMIYFGRLPGADGNRGASGVTSYSSEYGKWTVTKEDSNVLRFKFEEAENPSLDEYIEICGRDMDGKVIRQTFSVCRYPDLDF